MTMIASTSVAANNHYEESESFLRPASGTAAADNDENDKTLFLPAHFSQAASHPEKKGHLLFSNNNANNNLLSDRPDSSSSFHSGGVQQNNHSNRPVGPPVPIKPFRTRPNAPPPMAPPPPPPYFTNSTSIIGGGLTNNSSVPSRCYETVVGGAAGRSAAGCAKAIMRHKWMLGFAVVETMFGLIILMVGISCVVEVPQKCPYFTGCWVSGIFIVNGLVGIAAAVTGKANFIVAHLVLATVSVVSGIILTVFATIHWVQTGSTGGVPSYCVWNRYHPKLIQQVYEKMRDFDFKGCVDRFLKELKLGSTFNALLGSFGLFEIFLSLVSVIFCFRRLCNCGYGYDLDD